MGADIHIGDNISGDKIFQIGNGNVGKREGSPPPKRTVLVLMSNPVGTERLGLDEEYRAIEKALNDGPYRNRLDLRPGFAVRYDDLRGHLLRHRPVLVHYSGHNSADAGIVLTDAYGNARPITPDTLTELFAIVAESIRCVVLNACVTEAQAEAIAAHVPCAIGMSRAVLDSTAITFASAFYQAVSHGGSVGEAFRLGCNSLGYERGGRYRDLAPTAARPLRPGAIPVLLGNPEVADRTFIAS